MRCTGTTRRDHTGQLTDGDFSQLARAHFFAHQYGIRRETPHNRSNTLQPLQDTSAQITHVAGALAQVRVFHVLERRYMFANGVA